MTADKDDPPEQVGGAETHQPAGLPPALEHITEIAHKAFYGASTTYTFEELGEAERVLHEEAARLLRESRERLLPHRQSVWWRECKQARAEGPTYRREPRLEPTFLLDLDEEFECLSKLILAKVRRERGQSVGARVEIVGRRIDTIKRRSTLRLGEMRCERLDQARE